MDLEEKKQEEEWYDNPSIVTTILCGLVLLIVIISQSMAVNSDLSTIDIIRNILNHNSIYLLMLIYFALLKTKFGIKYFDYMNVLIIILYLITTFTSVLTLFQSFSLSNFIGLLLHVVLIIYMIHTFLRDTRFWKEFRLKNSMFNEFKNIDLFWTIVVLSTIDLSINLVFSLTYTGVVISVFDCIYYILFARYIYLYREYLDKKNIGVSKSRKVEKVNLEKAVADNKVVENKKIIKVNKNGLFDRLNSFADDLFLENDSDIVNDNSVDSNIENTNIEKINKEESVIIEEAVVEDNSSEDVSIDNIDNNINDNELVNNIYDSNEESIKKLKDDIKTDEEKDAGAKKNKKKSRSSTNKNKKVGDK